jgi:hypothetical protein
VLDEVLDAVSNSVSKNALAIIDRLR